MALLEDFLRSAESLKPVLETLSVEPPTFVRPLAAVSVLVRTPRATGEPTIRRTNFLPTSTLSVEVLLREALADDELDPVLQIDLASATTPYRDLTTPPLLVEDFYGFSFKTALERARESRTEDVHLGQTITAFARPFHWVGWNAHEDATLHNVAIIPDPRAILRVRVLRA